MSVPATKRPRPPPIKLTLPIIAPRYGAQSPIEDVMSPESYIKPYVLTDRQRAVVDEIQILRKKIQAANPRDKDDKATVISDKRLYLTGAFIAGCYYSSEQDTVLVSCLTQLEGHTHETRPNSIFYYNVKDCETINILRKIDIIIEWIDKQLADNKSVILHCYAGINRSASIALAYHCLKTGHDIVTGFKYLAEQRAGILSNTKFIEQLVVWADARGLLPKDS